MVVIVALILIMLLMATGCGLSQRRGGSDIRAVVLIAPKQHELLL